MSHGSEKPESQRLMYCLQFFFFFCHFYCFHIKQKVSWANPEAHIQTRGRDGLMFLFGVTTCTRLGEEVEWMIDRTKVVLLILLPPGPAQPSPLHCSPCPVLPLPNLPMSSPSTLCGRNLPAPPHTAPSADTSGTVQAFLPVAGKLLHPAFRHVCDSLCQQSTHTSCALRGKDCAMCFIVTTFQQCWKCMIQCWKSFRKITHTPPKCGSCLSSTTG